MFLAPSDASAALRNGAVAAWSTWVPYTTLALQEGARVLVDSHDLIDITSFDVANRQSVADKGALLTDFLRRESTAQLWALNNPDAYAPVLARETGMALAVTQVVARIHAFQQVPLDAAMVAAQQSVVDTYRHGGALTAQRSLTDAFAPLV